MASWNGGRGVYDVAVIGAGVCGANIVRRLSQYKLDIILLEKEVDVSFGTSKANSGIVHGGFHHSARYLKARLEVQGALMFDRLHRELGFPFRRCGIVVAALHEDEMRVVDRLYRQGVENAVIGIEMCSRERMLELEPKLNPDVTGGLYAPAGGIIEPYRFVFSLVESAVRNGVEVRTSFHLERAERTGGLWRLHSRDGSTVSAKYVVNSAGLYADDVSRAFGAEEYTIRARKGEYYLLDRLSKARPSRVVFPVPTSVSKGMLVVPTVEGTILIGPTAEMTDDKMDTATTRERLETILGTARAMIPAVSENDVITSFAGQRPVIDEDFLIEASLKVPDFVHVAGIQSPGLTASPAIGEYVKDILKRLGLRLEERPDYDPILPERHRMADADHYRADALVADDPSYGNIICRCEKVSEAEIVSAIKAGHTTLDGIKYFTRAQMGRCQGGFCTYKILKILQRETGMDWSRITKRGGGSSVLSGRL